MEVILWSEGDHRQQPHLGMEIATNSPLCGWNDMRTWIAPETICTTAKRSQGCCAHWSNRSEC